MCGSVTNVTPVFGNMLMCPDCKEIEDKAYKANNTPEMQQSRVDSMNITLELSREIDNNIQVRTDLFNAATVSIVELKSAIDSDDSIINKPYALASELKDRFEHFKSVVFELGEKIVDAGNQQKAIQVYLNNFANQLRVEEREKLKIADINYQPTKPKSIKVPSVRVSKKLDKMELAKYAKELGISEFTLQMVCVSQGIPLETAANKLRKSINEAKSESN